MKVFINLDTDALVGNATGGSPAPASISFKRLLLASLDVVFARNGAATDLTAGAVGIFEMKPVGKYDAAPVAGAGSWSKTGTGSDAVYTFQFTLISDDLDALFNVDDDEDNDVAQIELMGEIQWTAASMVHKSPTIKILLNNDIVRDSGETLPDIPTFAFNVDFLDINNLTGGTSSDLDGVPTTGLAVKSLINIVVPLGGTRKSFQLLSGAADGSDPGEVAPLDYDAGANDKHWKQVG